MKEELIQQPKNFNDILQARLNPPVLDEMEIQKIVNTITNKLYNKVQEERTGNEYCTLLVHFDTEYLTRRYAAAIIESLTTLGYKFIYTTEHRDYRQASQVYKFVICLELWSSAKPEESKSLWQSISHLLNRTKI